MKNFSINTNETACMSWRNFFPIGREREFFVRPLFVRSSFGTLFSLSLSHVIIQKAWLDALDMAGGEKERERGVRNMLLVHEREIGICLGGRSGKEGESPTFGMQ